MAAPDGSGGSPHAALHPLALPNDGPGQGAANAWCARTGRDFRIEAFGWIGWRGVFLTHPDGARVEPVAYDAAFRDAAAT